jgi:hypothetical protein
MAPPRPTETHIPSIQDAHLAMTHLTVLLLKRGESRRVWPILVIVGLTLGAGTLH